METVLVVSGVVFAAVVGLRQLFRRVSGFLKPPLRIHLVPARPHGFHGKGAQYRKGLEAKGFTHIGTYRVAQIRGLVLSAYVEDTLGVGAVVYDHPLAGSFVDMYVENVTVSNAPAGEELDPPPGREKVIDKTFGLDEIYDRILRERPEGPYRRIDAGNFVETLQAAYAREMDWRTRRGGPTAEEVRRSAQGMGIASERLVAKATETLRQQTAEQQRMFPCEIDEKGKCPYETADGPGLEIQGMPTIRRDARSCPKYTRVCPAFMGALGLSPEGLRIRAVIRRGSEAERLVKRGVLKKESTEYRERKWEAKNARRLYPKSKYPHYY
jgi:hypothetical protein